MLNRDDNNGSDSDNDNDKKNNEETQLAKVVFSGALEGPQACITYA